MALSRPPRRETLRHRAVMFPDRCLILAPHNHDGHSSVLEVSRHTIGTDAGVPLVDLDAIADLICRYLDERMAEAQLPSREPWDPNDAASERATGSSTSARSRGDTTARSHS